MAERTSTATVPNASDLLAGAILAKQAEPTTAGLTPTAQEREALQSHQALNQVLQTVDLLMRTAHATHPRKMVEGITAANLPEQLRDSTAKFLTGIIRPLYIDYAANWMQTLDHIRQLVLVAVGLNLKKASELGVNRETVENLRFGEQSPILQEIVTHWKNSLKEGGA